MKFSNFIAFACNYSQTDFHLPGSILPVNSNHTSFCLSWNVDKFLKYYLGCFTPIQLCVFFFRSSKWGFNYSNNQKMDHHTDLGQLCDTDDKNISHNIHQNRTSFLIEDILYRQKQDQGFAPIPSATPISPVHRPPPFTIHHSKSDTEKLIADVKTLEKRPEKLPYR